MKTDDQITPTIFTIFGGAGDLTWRKLVPALFDLSIDRSIPFHLSVIVIDRIEQSDAELKERLHDGVNKFSRQGAVNSRKWDQFAMNIYYQKGDFKKKETYTDIKRAGR